MIVYITIGNSDDKLTQKRWSSFVDHVCGVLYPTDYDGEKDPDHAIGEVHGVWFSGSASPYQNAVWCVDVKPERLNEVKTELRRLAGQFDQDSIAWAPTITVFLKPTPA